MAGRELTTLVAVTMLAGALRFATLGVQSFELDEAVTVALLDQPWAEMLDQVAASESTPPLYYLLARAWSAVFGASEAGLRSLSALLGTLTVPALYAAARTLLPPRTALLAAALVAVNPLLVWHSQQARAYALLAFLATAGLWLFGRWLARARTGEPAGGALAGWALISAAALATHYFAAFLILPQALWILFRARGAPRLLAPAAVAGAGLALVPLLLDQRESGAADPLIASSSTATRLAQVPKQFLMGFDSVAERPLAALAAIVAAAALVSLARSPQRNRVAPFAAVAGCGAGVPMVAALAGADYLVTRNVIGALPVLAVVVAAGLAAAGPSGLMGATALCAISLAAVTSVNLDPQLQRDDWRGVARALGPPRAGRVLLVRPASALAPLRVYRPGVRDARAGGVDTAELVVVELAERRPGLARLVPAPVLPSGLRTASGACRQVREDTFSLARCPVKPPRPVSPADLLAEEPARAVLHDAPTAP